MKPSKAEDYQKLQKLGEGTYGIVYKARNRQNNRIYALKKIRLESEEEGIPSTAIREIGILKELEHANTVKLEDTIHTNNKIVLVFQFVEQDLKKFMTKFKETGLSAKQVKSFCYQLLCGIHHIHSLKILHRDLKPQNLLISEKGILKIADFGLARATGIPTKGYTHEVVTLWYRPPDVLLGSQKYTETIDIWSIGCIFGEMVTMKPLFPGQTEEEELIRIFKRFGTPNSQTWPGVEELPHWNNYQFQKYDPEDFKQIFKKLDADGLDLLRKMLEMDPKKRITAEQALKHKYFDDISKEEIYG